MNCKAVIIVVCLILAPVVCQAQSEETIGWIECVKEAKKQHPDLVSAAEKISAAKASKEITRSA